MLTRWTLLDLECVALPNAKDYIPTIQAPANYTKPESIDAYVTAETAKALDKAGLDPDTCRIVCAGLIEHDGAEHVLIATDDDQERAILERVWRSVNRTTPMVGYGLTWYDAGVLVRRSQLLGVKVPAEFYKQGKYRHDWIVELADYLTLNGMIEQKKGRGLDYHCKRFGIQVEDAYSGKDIAALWREGNVEGIKAHCAADIERIRLLAERLDVIAPANHFNVIPVQPLEEAGAF